MNPGAAQATAIRAGIAEVDISPPQGHPLAGYSSRRPKGYVDIHRRCYGRALTLSSGSQQVTILTADLLIIPRNVSREILAKAGLKAEDVYFAVSHTHSGPGGYVDRFIEEFCLGKYSAEYFDDLTTKLAEVIRQSRRELVEVQMGLLTVDANDMLMNRIDASLPTYGKLSALVFRESGSVESLLGQGILSVMVSFGAHPTIVGHNERLLSSDYTGPLVDEIKRRTGAQMVMFAAGAVGSSRYKIDLTEPKSRFEQAEMYGVKLADKLVQRWDKIEYTGRLEMSNIRLEANLPPFRIGLGRYLRLNPLYTFWIADRRTHLHMVRIGKVMLAGFPADFGCDLAIDLDRWFGERGLEFIPTSFDGDWRGYAVTNELYKKYDDYETRSASFYGPWFGEYLEDLIKRMASINDEKDT